MPIAPAVAAAAIAGGSSVLGQGINAYAQGKMNKKTRKWNEKMYQRQRQDNLADWAMQNEYNSPQAQMARLKAAGLNPALVYENGATNTAQAVRGADTPQWNPKAPQFDLGTAAAQGIGAYYDAQVKQATTDNLKATNAVLIQEALLKAAQIGATIAGTNKTNFDLDLAKEIKSYSVEAARNSARKLGAEIGSIEANTQVTLDRNDREAAMNASNLREALERILSSRQSRLESQERILYSQGERKMQPAKLEKMLTEISASRQQIANAIKQLENMDKDGKLKDLEIQLRRTGVQPNDELWQRMLVRLLERLKLDPADVGIIPLD